MRIFFVTLLVSCLLISSARADSRPQIPELFRNAQNLSNSGHYISAAAIYFNLYSEGQNYTEAALARLTENLILAKLYNAATYFYIKTLQTRNRVSIKRILQYLPEMLDIVGGDVLRKYIVQYTIEGDYSQTVRSHFYYFLGKDALLKGEANQALSALEKVSGGAGVLAQTFQLKGTAYALLGKNQNAIDSFNDCRRLARKYKTRVLKIRKEAEDIEYRCTASLARMYYQDGKYDQAEETYDNIPKSSFVWTDILFEQAWNAYAKRDYNRTLGKLVTYRSPSLNFVFNPEVDVLRAQSFLALCIYDDVNKTVNEFNSKYADIGGEIKNFLLAHDQDLGAFFRLALQARNSKLHTSNKMNKVLNRFIRGPYFTALVESEKTTRSEYQNLKNLLTIEASTNPGFQPMLNAFSGFLGKVLIWRLKSIAFIGGAFVRNSLYDQYQDLIAQLDRISFIKLEMLKRSKDQLVLKQATSADENGVLKIGGSSIDRKDYQYYWGFNGEFWLDELGDYVFALESRCGT